MSDASVFSLTYRFRFPDGMEKEFRVRLDRQSGASARSVRDDLPDWTKLSYRQCRHCPLSRDEHTHCPVAVNIVDLVEFFQDFRSVEQVSVDVETPQRVSKREKTALFPAISSLMGIYMVTSGCPILDKLRPMSRFHLPFADTEETLYRAFSMYALAQYFRHRHSLEADWGFEGLKKIYKDVNRVNLDFSRRFHNESISEASSNAIISLDCFAQEIDFSITEEALAEIEVLFQGYLAE